MQITQFLNQTAELEAKTGHNPGWGDGTYADAVTIAVRKETKLMLLRLNDTQIYTPQTEYLTEEEISLGDLLDGEEVYAVQAIIDFDGSFLGMFAYPKPPTSFSQA